MQHNIKQEAIGLAEELEKSLQNGDVSRQSDVCVCVCLYWWLIELRIFRVNYRERKERVDFVPKHSQENHPFYHTWEIIR